MSRDARGTRVPGSWPLVGPSLFVPYSGDGGGCLEPFAGSTFELRVGFDLQDPVTVRIPLVTPPSGSVDQYGQLPS
jgi:hypothetical protein